MSKERSRERGSSSSPSTRPNDQVQSCPRDRLEDAFYSYKHHMDDTATFRDTAALVHDAPLPLALPLDHDLFLDDAFDVDDFLLARRHTSLDDLRSELRTYLSRLRNELVGVINEDYEDFIGLGIGLRGTDKRLERMRRPVEDVRTEIEVRSRSCLVQGRDISLSRPRVRTSSSCSPQYRPNSTRDRPSGRQSSVLARRGRDFSAYLAHRPPFASCSRSMIRSSKSRRCFLSNRHKTQIFPWHRPASSIRPHRPSRYLAQKALTGALRRLSTSSAAPYTSAQLSWLECQAYRASRHRVQPAALPR